MKSILTWAGVALLIILGLWLISWPVEAHNAPLGWPYPTNCCNELKLECDQIPTRAVKELPDRYELHLKAGDHRHVHENMTLEIYKPHNRAIVGTYESGPIRWSKDSYFHACIEPEYEIDPTNWGPFGGYGMPQGVQKGGKMTIPPRPHCLLIPQRMG